MKTGRKYEPVRETRCWYYVEYLPLTSGNKFAWLNLIITESRPKKRIVKAMEKEVELWLTRYPVPIFATAWNDKEDRYDFSGIRPNNHLIGIFDSNNKVRLHWESVKDEEIPDLSLDQEFLDNLYSNLKFKTYAELDVERQKRIKGIRTGYFLIFIWLVVIPMAFSILEFSSDLLSAVVLLYSASKGIETWLELRGKLVKSKREIEKEEEERLKNHYYYHYQMNPEGFRRLKLENFEKMAKDQIAKEAESLKRDNKLD
jgi:hypothetical protein